MLVRLDHVARLCNPIADLGDTKKKGSQLLPPLALFRRYFSLRNLRYELVESVRH